jgi:hypothetical protein
MTMSSINLKHTVLVGSEGRALEMHQIRYFLAVSETLNLTKAAERCNVTQPSLSRAIKAFETELGGELLRRERALSHLTELGHAPEVAPVLRISPYGQDGGRIDQGG